MKMKKKKGYTLAEVLIALGIVGFISAIMLPMINKIKPDPTKITYIKTFDAIMAATQEIAGNALAYPLQDDEKNPTKKYNKCPLFNTAEVKVNGIEYGGDNAKFCQFLGTTINTIDSTVNCKKDPIIYSDDTFKNNISFTGTNGVQYLVSTDTTGGYRTDIYIDVNGDEGKNCMYVDGGTCKNPDRFKLSVAANGLIVPQDKVGAKYLEERKDWTKRSVGKADIKDITNIISSLKPENIATDPATEPYYKNCEGYKYNGMQVTCSGFMNPYNTDRKEPFMELHSNQPLKYDEYFFNPYKLPNSTGFDGVLMCKFPAGATEAYCGTESLFLKNGVEEQLKANGITKEDMLIAGSWSVETGGNRLFKYDDDSYVRYIISGGLEVDQSEYLIEAGYKSEIDASYRILNEKTTPDTPSEKMQYIKRTLENVYKMTEENNPELFNYLNN